MKDKHERSLKKMKSVDSVSNLMTYSNILVHFVPKVVSNHFVDTHSDTLLSMKNSDHQSITLCQTYFITLPCVHTKLRHTSVTILLLLLLLLCIQQMKSASETFEQERNQAMSDHRWEMQQLELKLIEEVHIVYKQFSILCSL